MAVDHPARVRLEVRAETRFLHIVRLTTAGTAAQAGLSVEEIEDVKIAVDELCTAACVVAPDDGVLSVGYDIVADGLAVSGSVAGGGDVAIDELVESILDATADHYELDAASFRLRKRRGH